MSETLPIVGLYLPCILDGKLKLLTSDQIYFASRCHRPHDLRWIREGEKAVETYCSVYWEDRGAASVGENVVGGLSWVPFTVGGLSWLVLVSSWDFRQPKSFSGLIHRRIINPRLQGFPSFVRGKPWLRFVEGLSLFRRKGIITKAMFAPIY